ncbi:hypothetical protein PR202_gb20531 [Eleusine coracana subsp. coracana]|uniref:Uncharacterized protein n=1 Tax=Eleusine coracana subsp. coracana TaxID=191504 RepID=A0AAV5FAZ1_ELECO|nr:hypothetical protein PR202_gb20531 [Eleusine coracana subsp. coracana]
MNLVRPPSSSSPRSQSCCVSSNEPPCSPPGWWALGGSRLDLATGGGLVDESGRWRQALSNAPWRRAAASVRRWLSVDDKSSLPQLCDAGRRPHSGLLQHERSTRGP